MGTILNLSLSLPLYLSCTHTHTHTHTNSQAGRRLPTELEWETAARGGLEDELFSWGSEFDERMCNGWQGKFPDENDVVDGYDGVSPTHAYEPNPFGLYGMIGNVWEWTNGGTKDSRPMRGGSFVDTLSGDFNHALRVSTRMMNTPDSSASNTGFRCASSVVVMTKKRTHHDGDEI